MPYQAACRLIRLELLLGGVWGGEPALRPSFSSCTGGFAASTAGKRITWRDAVRPNLPIAKVLTAMTYTATSFCITTARLCLRKLGIAKRLVDRLLQRQRLASSPGVGKSSFAKLIAHLRDQSL